MTISSVRDFVGDGDGDGGDDVNTSGPEPVHGDTDSDDIMGPSDSDEDDDAGQFSAVDLLDRMRQGWINESLSPVLLPPLNDLKEAILRLMSTMKRNIETLDKGDVRTVIHNLELDRIQYMLVSYLRKRLFKIQANAWYYNHLEKRRRTQEPSLMTSDEIKFLHGYIKAHMQYTQKVVANFPEPMRKVDNRQLLLKPRADIFVLYKAARDFEVMVEDPFANVHHVDVRQEENYVMRYAVIGPSVIAGNVKLL